MVNLVTYMHQFALQMLTLIECYAPNLNVVFVLYISILPIVVIGSICRIPYYVRHNPNKYEFYIVGLIISRVFIFPLFYPLTPLYYIDRIIVNYQLKNKQLERILK